MIPSVLADRSPTVRLLIVIGPSDSNGRFAFISYNAGIDLSHSTRYALLERTCTLG